MKKIQKGIFRHYKGNYYEVIDVATHSETLEDMVIYRSLRAKDELWVRPLHMFLEIIEINEQQRSRFEFIGDIESLSINSIPGLKDSIITANQEHIENFSEEIDWDNV